MITIFSVFAILFIVLCVMIASDSARQISKVHPDSYKGSYYEISNRRDK